MSKYGSTPPPTPLRLLHHCRRSYCGFTLNDNEHKPLRASCNTCLYFSIIHAPLNDYTTLLRDNYGSPTLNGKS